MLDNPQKKLNQQVQSDQASISNQSPNRLQPDTKPDLAQPAQSRLSDNKGNSQTVPEDPQAGFSAQLQNRLKQHNTKRLQQGQKDNPPQRDPNPKASSSPSPQANPSPQVPKPQIPKSGFKRPSTPKPPMPKMPKLR